MAGDEGDRRGPTRGDAVRFGLFMSVLAGVGVWSLVLGLQRSGSDGRVHLVLGVLMLLCVLGFGVGVAGVRRRERGMSPAERAAARAARLEEARRRRPAWLDSRGFEAVSALLAVYWTYALVVGAMAGDWRQVVVRALLLALSVSGAVRAHRNRAASVR